MELGRWPSCNKCFAATHEATRSGLLFLCLSPQGLLANAVAEAISCHPRPLESGFVGKLLRVSEPTQASLSSSAGHFIHASVPGQRNGIARAMEMSNSRIWRVPMRSRDPGFPSKPCKSTLIPLAGAVLWISGD